jgi:glycerol-3-phosphate dehydrogenase
MIAVPQIPYAGIGLGVALLLGVWAFLVAETVKERAIIAIAPVLAFAVRVVIPTRAGRVISLVGLMVYGIGCIIYLRLNGMGIR